ncbi:DUF484 family protein [Brackiella oedipodis]|uniref:DUF484 family protein n=1 Tax=Brackiella oedipodis TaxID=124225 RepID=UPI00048DE6FC|nr:DUF484 family protein [Brackiella oedipodis]
MTSEALTAQQVAQFLQQNPDFFAQHAELFSELELANPKSGKSLSLPQRQFQNLRDKVVSLEQHIRELSIYAFQSHDIGQSVTAWCVALLAENDARKLPRLSTEYLQQAFPELKVALRLWGEVDAPEVQCDDKEFQEQVASMTRAFTGSPCPPKVAEWFEQTPASVAILPLYNQQVCFGVLAFASDNPEHFSEDMEQDFLIMISALASAALSRLYPPQELVS